MIFYKLPIYALAAALITAPTVANAWWWWHGDDDDDDEVVLPLEEAELFFELNDSDGDLGIHGFADGEEWKELEIEGPHDRELMEIKVKSRLKRQGVTELFFESAEPCFPEDCDEDDLPGLNPKKFFKRFPQGTYEIEVETLEGDELESEIYLSHVIPAAPVVTDIGGDDNGPAMGEECWDSDKGDGDDVMVSWEAVTMSHASLPPGTVPIDIADDVMYYEFVVEVDEADWKSSSIIPAKSGINSKKIPADFFALTAADAGGEYKIEILVRVDNGFDNPGNKSAVETCFEYDNEPLEP